MTEYTFEAEYEDGTIIKGLSPQESWKLFTEALGSDNQCRVRPEIKED